MAKKIWKFIVHNQFIIAFGVVAIALVMWGHGCESQVLSLSGNGEKVPRSILQAELDKYLVLAENRFADLNRQDQFKQAILNHALVYTTTGTLDPLGLITTIAGLIGIGAVIDNRRKDSVIKTLKNSNSASKNNVTNGPTGPVGGGC